MLSYLAELEDLWGPFRLFGSLTFRAVLAGAFALFLGWILGPQVIHRLQVLKARQVFRDRSEVGKLADLHASKAGIPTMGGLMIYASVTLSTILLATPNRFVLTALLVYSGLTALGFWDDFTKISRKHSGGISSRWKLGGQGVIAFIAMAILLSDTSTHTVVSQLWLPFLKTPLIAWMPLAVLPVFFFLVIGGCSNAINLTDGVDGLAIGCTVTSALAFGVMSYAAGNAIVADYLLVGYIPGAGELGVLCSALVGGSLAFLWFNAHPATVFMGDTGSLALGGLIGSVAFMIQQPFTLVIVGGIFVMEAVSVLLQVGSFKLTGKRIFRMAPIHHHFEMGGMAEPKIVIRFWIMSLLFAMAGLLTLKLR